MPLAPIPRFYKWKKPHENIPKWWANPASLKKSLKIIGRKFSISSSNKMKLPLNASKKTQTVRAGSLKNLRNI